MKLLQYVQVLFLIFILVGVALLHLENPFSLRLPFLSERISVGSLVLFSVLMGAVFASLVFVPLLLRSVFRERKERKTRLGLQKEAQNLPKIVETPPQ